MGNPKVQDYAEFFFAGIFVSDHSSQKVDCRDVSSINWPERAYAVRFYSRREFPFEGDVLVGNPYDFSPKTFRYGTIKTIEEVRRDEPESILLRNMETNGWHRIVECAQGALPMRDGDMVMAPMDAPSAQDRTANLEQ